MPARNIPITIDGDPDPASRLFGAKLPTISYGVTLARLMEFADARGFIDGRNHADALGGIYIELRRSQMPGILDVEAAVGLSPATALIALQVADQRIRQLNDLAEGRLPVMAISQFDATVLRETAEELVRMIRGRDPSPEDFSRKFHLSLEDAIERVTAALRAALVRSSALFPERADG